MLRKGRTLHRLSNLVKPKEITSVSEKNDACSFANYATKDKPSEEATSRLYKSLGMKPPKPRRQSMEARRLNAVLKRNQEGLARYALSSASHPGSHRNVPSTQRAAKTKSRLFATQEGSHGTGETSEDEQVERILEAGSKQLFGSEEGKERLRENSYSNDETAKTVLNAAHEALDQSEDNAGDGERGSRDQVRAKEASEKIEKGKENGVGSKVKAKVVGIGRIS